MCISGDIHDAYVEYQEELVEAGLLIPLGVKGVYGRSGTFEHIIDQFENYITRNGAQFQAEVMRFPPIFNRAHYERIDHINNFPDLLGSVHSFTGRDREHMEMLRKFEAKEDWSRDLNATEVMLVPAACYPLYPTATGTLPADGRLVDLETFVFRHEPSDDPARMQIFRQREYVRLGTPEAALQHRDYWLGKSRDMLASVGLDVTPVIANDPFFGRGGRVMKATQLEQNLKYELVVPICSTEKPTAVASCNMHLDHFGVAFDIKTSDGQVAHTACVGFGLERIALALFKTHGFKVESWPAAVREILELS
ncbi:MAG: amino acid--[acyl-carrier-protein] ligase [Abitibacteriaceae bacterium]|nr:amino acid--[acyl-carrier-protein] ligase [Abditibacteriaceae bacterium]MBV9864545.1 amino acid--[acyl-carrier-protein] ligase [Abditibacteriaceae bacterium]